MKISTIRPFSIILFFHLALATASCDRCKQVVCENGAQCEEGACVCPEGFSGESCEVEDLCLTRIVDCSENGTCIDGQCICEEGFSGNDCSKEDKCITNDITCLNGGSCNDGKCKCVGKYRGERCEIYDECVGVNCQNNQPCNNGQCECNDFTTGEFCENKVIDQYIRTYEGFWQITGTSISVSTPGTLQMLPLNSNEKRLNATIGAQIYNNELLLEFIPSALDQFNVLRVDGNLDCTGGGHLYTGKLMIDFDAADQTQGSLNYLFEED